MVNLSNYLHINAQLAASQHKIYFGEGLLTDRQLIQSQVAADRVCIITNTTLQQYYLTYLKECLAGLNFDVIALPDGECFKNSDTLNSIYDHLIKYKHGRDTTIFALGGGVVGDIAGYAAATYQRGVRLVHFPTSLLAQVDSSVGGKTAINHPLAKNMIGSFYFPHSVITDIATLRTLPERELRAGFAEVIKYALLVGGDFLENLPRLFALDFSKDDLTVATAMIAKSCGIKLDVVKQDEQEKAGVRQLLNLGHTFAHGIESVTHYKRFLHGEAVAIGLYLAARLSYQLNYISAQQVDYVESLLKQAGLPWQLPEDIDPDDLKVAMLRDKKVRRGKLPFVVIRAFGNCALENGVTEEHLDIILSSVTA